MKEEKSIILFDGMCNLCSGFVDFIIKHQRRSVFEFIPLQSEEAGVYLPDTQTDSSFDSVFYFERGKIYKESTAAFKIIRKLNGLWPLLYVLIVIPPFIRDGIYRWVAGNRYKWFGKRKSCRLPEEFNP